jgi:RNA polymerase sigma-70 factor, ECF subfamily
MTCTENRGDPIGWPSTPDPATEIGELIDASGRSDVEQLLAKARAGDADCLGWLLETYRNYLHLLASAQLNERLRRRVNPSDLVQETFLRASRHFGEFCGSSEQEWLGWLRTILRRRLLKMVHRQVVARKRSVSREFSFQELAMRSGSDATGQANLIASPGSSPSTHVLRQELSGLLAERLSRLPGPYREVLVLRHLEGLSFNEVADRMGRPPGAVRVLWLRALERLRRQPMIEELR